MSQTSVKRPLIRRIKGLCLGILLLVLFVAVASSKTTITGATSIVHDYAADGSLLLFRSDDFNGSGEATYTSTSGVSNTVTNGEWVLSLYNQSVRTFWITPNDSYGSQPAGEPAAYYWNGTEAKSSCFDQSGNRVPLGNVLTSSGNCKLGVNFNAGGNLYKLLMSPFPLSEPGDAPATCPSTGCPPPGVVTVTCNKVSNGQCVSWTVVPNTAAPNATVANLYRYSSKGRDTTWIFIGQYYNTLRIDITTP